jgi:hypothetical protein
MALTLAQEQAATGIQSIKGDKVYQEKKEKRG